MIQYANDEIPIIRARYINVIGNFPIPKIIITVITSDASIHLSVNPKSIGNVIYLNEIFSVTTKARKYVDNIVIAAPRMPIRGTRIIFNPRLNTAAKNHIIAVILVFFSNTSILTIIACNPNNKPHNAKKGCY